tara:strand:+ start:337 stop:591 length:255 start_codon:yes stop_codon:yes gene_type:complete
LNRFKHKILVYKSFLKTQTPVENAPQMPKEEEIGFHKGALNTLAAERNELVKMIGNVEAIMQAHLKRLEELGVKIETQTKEEKK